MEAVATGTFDQDPQSHAQGTIAAEGHLYRQLALLEFKRIALFDEIDRQLFDLSRAASASIAVQPSHNAAGPFDAAPLTIPEIVVPRQIEERALIGPQSVGFRAAAIVGVLLVGLGLALFGTLSLIAILRGPNNLTDKAAVDAVVDRIITAESGGDASMKNKRSSAAGPAQFIDETWLEMIRAYRPDLAKALNRKETLELRHHATIAREITMRFAERNAALLRRRGLPVTAGTIYLAHFAGGAGAVALLSAPADADAAMVMANADATGKTKRDAVVKANPFLERFTVADLKRWAEHKMQGPGYFLTELFSASGKK